MDEPTTAEVKPQEKIEIFPWAVLIDKLFKKEKIIGLEGVKYFDFDFLLQQHIENYTIYIESRFLFNTLKEAGKKLIIKKLLKADSLQFPIYYYIGLLNNLDEGFVKILKTEPRIKSVIEFLDKTEYRGPNGGQLIKHDLDNIFVPNVIVDMLKLIYHTDENIRNINAVVLFSNNIKLIPTIKELIDNDIAVYLGVSKYLKTSPKLMTACSAVFNTEAYLQGLDALVDIKGTT